MAENMEKRVEIVEIEAKFRVSVGEPLERTIKPVRTIDTFRHDEATQVIEEYTAGGGAQEWSELEERRLRRKIDLKLIPVVCFTLFMQYYDKSIMAQAALFGFRTDLGLTTGNRFSFSSSIFYLGYLVGSYPITMLAQRYPTARVVSILIIVWGVCLILTTVCTGYRSLYAQRFVLGMLEGPASPVFTLICGGWYKKDEQALRLGYNLACNAVAIMFTPLINYGLGSIQNTSIATWKIMYLLPAAITIVWGFAIWFLLPADPISARGFTLRERYIAVSRLRTNNSGVRNKHIKLKQIRELMVDVKFWLAFSIAVLMFMVNGAVSTFTPTIIHGFGYSPLHSLLLSMIHGAFGTVLIMGISVTARRVPGSRCWMGAVVPLVSCLAAVLLWKLPLRQKGALLFATTILGSGMSGYSLIVSLQLANTAGYTKRSASSAGIFVGYCLGNFIGPLLFLERDAPRYAPAFAVITSTSAAASVLVLVYRYVCLWYNRKRDRAGIPESFDHAYDDDLTDLKNPQFRYIV